MTTISLPQFADGNLLTNSAVKCWNACRRRFYFQYVLGVRKAWASEPLRVGSMWHLGVGLYESGMPIAEALQTVRNAYADQPCPPYLQPEEYQVEEEKVVAMVHGHWAHWSQDAIMETLAIELPFSVPIINPDTNHATPCYVNAGVIDRIARLPDGRVALVERKTYGGAIGPEEEYWQALRNDAQISRYMLAAKALSYDVVTTVYDVMCKPAIRQKDVSKAERANATANGNYYSLKLTAACPERETPAMYGARLLADIQARPDFYLARNEIPRLADDLDEFQADLWQTQQDIRQAVLGHRFARRTESCLEPYACDYLDTCRSLWREPDAIPEGFRRVERLHEEIAEATARQNPSPV